MLNQEQFCRIVFWFSKTIAASIAIFAAFLYLQFSPKLYGQTAQVTDKGYEMADKIPKRSGGSYLGSIHSSAGVVIGPYAEKKISQPVSEVILNSFEGFNFDDNATETGFFFIPPDPIGAAGTDRVIAVVNVMIEAWDKTGTTLLFRDALRDFFTPLQPLTFTFDPKIV
jgi:hypothetical protein